MDIIELLYKINRWWLTGKVEEAFLFRKTRREYNAIRSQLENRRILSLIGPRRVGKSTLLFQTIDGLLKSNVQPKRILFFSGDEPGLFTEKNSIHDIIEPYIKNVLSEKLEDISSKVYIFIDEIHFLKGWQLYLKSYYDKRYNIKFIISGSSSTHLSHQSRESLLGRIEEVFILPLDFKQFYEFYSVYKDNSNLVDFGKYGVKASLYENVDEYYNVLKSDYYQLKEYEIPINRILKEYLLVGGYPEYFENDNILLWQKRLVEDIITRGLYRDIVNIYSIKNPEILEKLLYFIAANQGQAFAYSSLAQTMGVDAVTISSYLNYLSQAFLIGIQDNYSTNVGKVIRKNKKLFVIDNGIRNAMLKVDQLTPSVEGQLVENCAVHNVKLFAESNRYNVFYWRDEQKEVDIVLDMKTGILPLEVKYRNNIEESDMKGLQTFIIKYNSSSGIVITKDLLDLKNNIYYIPFWMMSLK